MDGNGLCLAVAVLGHNDLRGILVHVLGDLSALAGGVVGLPVKKDDNVRVLLDRAGIPQLRQAGPVVLGALGGTAQLGQGDHRHVQLLGQHLQVSGDLGNLVDAVVAFPGAVHQLQIVHNHQVHMVQAAELALHLQHRQGGGVVNVNIRPAENVPRLDQPGPLGAAQIAGAQLGAFHQGLGGQQAGGQLLPAHFQREKGHPPFGGHRHMPGNIQGQAGFSHAGAGRQHNQVRAV